MAVKEGELPLPDSTVLSDISPIRYKLTQVDGEEGDRQRFLEGVTVDNGVARSIDPETGVQTSIAAVQIHNHYSAAQVPLELDGGELTLTLSRANGAHFGLIFAHNGEGLTSAAVRQGDYPTAEPLVTTANGSNSQAEYLMRMAGINRRRQRDEKQWVEQLNLEGLGFVPGNTLALFSRLHSDKPSEGLWTKMQPFEVLHPDMHDLIPHQAITADRLQVLTYHTNYEKPSFGLTKGAAITLMNRQVANYSFGAVSPYIQMSQPTPEPQGLASAFQVRMKRTS